MDVHAFTRNDLDALAELRPDGWPDITPSFDYYIKSSFCFPVKITDNKKIVGTGATIIHRDVAWLAHIIVHKEYRKRGIGKLITETLIDSLKSSDCETIYLLATDLGAPVYEKVGFETETEYLFFKNINNKENGESTGRIVRYHEKFKNEIAVIDQITSGEDRMFHLEEHLQSGFVYIENDKVSGFYLPAFGDGLILATDAVAGLGLVKFHLKANDKLVFPRDNTVMTNFLYEKGYKETAIGKRMRLGKRRPVNFENIYNRIAGNLG